VPNAKPQPQVQAPDPSVDPLTPHEAAATLRVNVQNIYKLIRTKQLPHNRVGRAVRIWRKDLMSLGRKR
jgi:excisionase family DNA binding protein